MGGGGRSSGDASSRLAFGRALWAQQMQDRSLIVVNSGTTARFADFMLSAGMKLPSLDEVP